MEYEEYYTEGTKHEKIIREFRMENLEWSEYDTKGTGKEVIVAVF